MKFILIFVGGGLGSIARYVLGSYIHVLIDNTKFPVGTFTVNIIGSALIGFLAYLLYEKSGNNYELYKMLIITGFLGGFTTFSSFSLEMLSLLQKGFYIHWILYSVGSVVLGLTASALGWMISKIFFYPNI